MKAFYRGVFVLFVGVLVLLNNSVTFAQSQSPSGPRETKTFYEQTGGIDMVGQIGGALADTVVQGDYAYMAVGPRIIAVDVSTPAHTRLVGRSGSLPMNISALAIQNNHLYATSADKLYIFSIEIRSAHQEVILTQQGSYQANWGGTSLYDATDVAVNGRYAFVTFATGGTLILEKGVLAIIDVSNPAAPSLVGSDDDNYYPQAVAAAGNKVYVAGGNFVIYDVSDPAWPTVAFSDFDSHTNVRDLAVAGNYLYTSNFGGDGFRVWDVSVPANAREVGSYNPPWGAAGGIAVDYPYAYVSDSGGGLRILNVSNPANPSEVGAYDLSSDVHGPHLSALDVAVVGNTAYVNIGGSDFHIVNLQDHAHPVKIGSYSNFPIPSATSVKVVGNMAYVASNGLDILNVADPTGPRVVGQLKTAYTPLDVDVAGHYAYLLTDFGLHIIDVSNPAAPHEIGSYQDPYGGLTYLTVAGNYAYLIAQGSGLSIIDISSPAHPTMVVKRYNFNGRPFILSRPIVHGASLYVTSNCVLRVLDISDPAHLHERTSKSFPGCPRDLALATYPQSSDEYLYLAEEPLHGLADGGLRIVHLGSLDEAGYYKPPRISEYDSYRPNFVAVADQSFDAYLIEQANTGRTSGDWVYTLRLVDLHDLAHPTLVGTTRLESRGGIPDAMGKHVFIPDGTSGLKLFRRGYTYSEVIDATGGDFSPYVGNAYFSFPGGTFTHPTTITYKVLSAGQMPSTGALIGAGHYYQISAVDNTTGQSVQPGAPYTLRITYTASQRGGAIENSLRLSYWNGTRWVKEPTGLVVPSAHVVVATPDHFSTWAILGETNRTFLPVCVSP